MKIKRVLHRATDGYEALIKDAHDNKLYYTRVQDTDPYYRENRLVRQNTKKSDIRGKWALPIGNIPFADYQEAKKRDPELCSPNAEIKTKAWLRFLRQSQSEQLRTVNRNLIPDSMTPDRGSIILPSRVQKEIHKEQTDAV